MSDRVILNGAFRLVVTDALKKLLNQFVQRRFPRPEDLGTKAKVLAALLEHGYLLHDPWSAAEERRNIARVKRCLAMLKGFRTRLERGDIHYKGIENATGQPELNSAKLKAHSVRMLDLSDDWLLLSIDRHPEGGAGVERRQYWLYSRQQSVLQLLRAQTVARIKEGQWKVQRAGGPWRDVDDTLERDFFDTVEQLIGLDACEAIRQSGIPLDRLCHLSNEVLNECLAVCGIDYQAEETQRRELRERTYLKKYGPRKPGLISISAAAIELIYADENDTDEP